MKKTFAILLPCSLLSGCAMVGPDYQSFIPFLPQGWSQAEAGKEIVRSEAASDISQWWRSLNDPLLSALVEEALQASPDMRSAQARLREARARRTVAEAGLFPGVDASLDARRSKSSAETGTGAARNVYGAGFDASWEIDVFGGTRRSIEAAEADLQSSEAGLHDVQVSLAAEIALNYVELRAYQLRLRIARDNLASQAETLQLTDWRAQAGLVSSQDVEQARTNYEQTRAQMPNLERSYAEAENRLAILLGNPPGSLHERLTAAPARLPDAPATVAIGIPADTLRQRPDVRAAERRLAAETARVGVAEAARYPSINLTGSIGLEALRFGALGNGGADTYSLLAGISAPIFNAGRLRAQVDIQDAVREQALISYEQTVLDALGEVENALVALAKSRERERALGNAAISARNAALLARNRYSAGLIDFQSVLDTERSMLAVEDSLASTRADGISALIRLYKALGGGWSPPENQSQRGSWPPRAETSPTGKDTA
ncbi:MAG: efflux transporter outer membrane subunit [Pseudomonadota bacterium]